MRTVINVVVCAAGLATSALGQTRVEFQVSPAGAESWTGSINAAPGQSIDIRARVSYLGTASPLGFGSMECQPTLSNWDAASNGDVFTPLVNNGVGGAGSSPMGEVPDAAGQYGRITPFGYRNHSSTAALRGMVNTFGGTTYLRISPLFNGNWIGIAPNIDGYGGMLVAQNNNLGRIASDPAFNPATQNVVVFKYNITLGGDGSPRTMIADVPVASFAGAPDLVKWYASMTEPVGTISGGVSVNTASIVVVPSPGVMGLGMCASILAVRRRRGADAR